MQFYVNYYDQDRRTDSDNPTLGLVLCSDKNDAVVRYTLGGQQKRNIFASRYQLHLPTVEELQQELVRERLQIGTEGAPPTAHRAASKPRASAQRAAAGKKTSGTRVK